jgi:Ser-tRNA(Ala) deacylase AlaX
MSQHPGINPPPFRSTISAIDKNIIFLKDSFCYPRGGGQQGDTGMISKINLETELLETLPWRINNSSSYFYGWLQCR